MSERIPRQDPTALEHLSHIELPASTQPGGFDHAAVHRGMARLYVAHTANDAVDVIDCAGDRYLRSLGGLAGVAGVLVAEEQNLFFTSNRGENSVIIFSVLTHGELARVAVGVRPNGLAHDSRRNRLLAVNVGDPGVIDVFDTAAMRRIGSVPAEKGTHIRPDFLPLLEACFSAFGRSSIFTDERYAARWHAKRAKAVIDAVAKSDTRTNLLRLRQYRPAMEWLMPEVKHGIAATLAQLDPPWPGDSCKSRPITAVGRAHVAAPAAREASGKPRARSRSFRVTAGPEPGH